MDNVSYNTIAFTEVAKGFDVCVCLGTCLCPYVGWQWPLMMALGNPAEAHVQASAVVKAEIARYLMPHLPAALQCIKLSC